MENGIVSLSKDYFCHVKMTFVKHHHDPQTRHVIVSEHVMMFVAWIAAWDRLSHSHDSIAVL